MRNAILFLILVVALLLAFLLSVSIGVVKIPLADFWTALMGRGASGVTGVIVWDMRIPRTCTAVLAGAGISVAGLVMQTVFRNPLAGPYVLGVSSGASLGVAWAILLGAGQISGGVVGAGTFGAMGVMAVVLWLARFCRSPLSLLVLGLMVGYLADALVSLMIHFGDAERLHSFLSWGFGSFGRVHGDQLFWLLGTFVFGLLLLLPSLKYLNTVLLGETVAQSLGIAVRKHRVLTLGASSLLTAVVTVFCGPVGFLGLAVPHLARSLFHTADHRVLLPASMLLGACLAVLAGWVTNLPSSGGVLPLNSITALIGVPVVFWALLRRNGGLDD
ncbi:MAG TPA: iron ABC transporter permease [Fibrobacteraceae bacterium]|nr:iron ABC transporter permease [Fibrobacteraceae bacterium]